MKLTASNIRHAILDKLGGTLPAYSEKYIKMGLAAYTIYIYFIASQNPNVTFPLNYYGVAIELDETLNHEEIIVLTTKKP